MKTPHITEIGTLWDRIVSWFRSLFVRPPIVFRTKVRDVTASLEALEPTDGLLTVLMQKAAMERTLITGVME